jgi:hypothetical protein
MNNQTKLNALQAYFDLMSMNGGARIYRPVIEYGIFAASGSGPASARSFAGACGLHERAVGFLLDALWNIGAVRREGIR